MNKLVLQDAFSSNKSNYKLAESDFESLDFLILFNIYQELMFKELLDLKHDAHDAANNFETLVLEFSSMCDDIF